MWVLLVSAGETRAPSQFLIFDFRFPIFDFVSARAQSKI